MAYTAWSVTFGEQPSAAKWNQLGTNDAGFYDGTGFSFGIGHGLLLLADVSNSGQATISSGTIPAVTSLRVVGIVNPSTTMDVYVRFNGDGGNNYAYRIESAGAADATASSAGAMRVAASTSSPSNTFVFDIPMNIATSEKNIMGFQAGSDAGAANIPSKRMYTGKWANSSDQITSITIGASTGNLGTARIRIFGA